MDERRVVLYHVVDLKDQGVEGGVVLPAWQHAVVGFGTEVGNVGLQRVDWCRGLEWVVEEVGHVVVVVLGYLSDTADGYFRLHGLTWQDVEPAFVGPLLEDGAHGRLLHGVLGHPCIKICEELGLSLLVLPHGQVSAGVQVVAE